MKAHRIDIEFSKDYAEFKKGDSLTVGRSLAHQLITIENVATVKSGKSKKETKSKEDKPE